MTIPVMADDLILDLDVDPAEYAEVVNNDGRLGDVGRLIIPDVGIDVAVYYASDNNTGYAQSLTNNTDSALYMPWTDEEDFIADHWSQGFINIKDCVEGTRAYLKKDDRVVVYRCTEATTGHNLLDFFLINTDKAHEYRRNLTDEQPLEYYTYPHEWVSTNYECGSEVFWGQPLENISDYDVFMYTCDGRWQDIYICLFELEQELPLP